MRIDAAAVVGVRDGTIPEATAAAEPPLEPPSIRLVSQGLLAGAQTEPGSVVGTEAELRRVGLARR